MKPGDQVIWLHTPRSGHGYTERIPGVVVKVTAKRVTIEVKKLSGETVRRVVRPEHIITPEGETLTPPREN